MTWLRWFTRYMIAALCLYTYMALHESGHHVWAGLAGGALIVTLIPPPDTDA